MIDRATILVMITKADVGGAQVHVLEILEQLRERYRFVLAAGEDDYLTRSARELGVEVRIIPLLQRPINLRRDVAALNACVDLLREVRPDLLHTHSSKAGVIGRLAAWHVGVPSLFTAHGWAFTEGAPRLQRVYGLLVESILCRLVGKVITISEYDYKLAARFRVGAERDRYLVRNGISDPGVRRQHQNGRVPHILTVGRLSPVKNHLMLLDALAQLNCPFTASIIGAGECRSQLTQRINTLGLGDRVQLLGEITATTEHLAKADLFVLSSNYEGLPLSVLEAMSMQLPVVATDVGGVGEAVLDQESGLLSPRGDVAALAENMQTLLLDPGLALRFGQRAYQHYRAQFTAGRMLDQLEPIYRELVDARG